MLYLTRIKGSQILEPDYWNSEAGGALDSYLLQSNGALYSFWRVGLYSMVKNKGKTFVFHPRVDLRHPKIMHIVNRSLSPC